MSGLYEVISKRDYATVGIVEGRSAATTYAMEYFETRDCLELEKRALIREYIGVEVPWVSFTAAKEDNGDAFKDAFVRGLVRPPVTKQDWSELDLLDRGIVIGWLICFGMLALLLALLLKH